MKFNKEIAIGHLCMAGACAMWGLMAPLGKDAMTHGITGLDMVAFRVTGGALCFWLTSLLWQKSEKKKVEKKDLLKLFFAALFAIVFNQCNYTIGLSITSPLNASIMTTTMPIITMVLAAVFIKEPVTWKKVLGVLLGASGAAILILGSSQGVHGGGVLLGDILCICAQCSYAIYLTAFKTVIQKYSVVTCMKWMMTFAALVIVPFAMPGLMEMPWSEIEPTHYAEAAFVVFGGTFIAYILCTSAQKVLRPTVVAMYNYVQPIVSCVVSVIIGLGVFGIGQAFAVVLVFSGVWLVTQSRKRRDQRAIE